MKLGLAIWHYPHRTLCENIDFFASHGFDAVSGLGDEIVGACRDSETAKALAAHISANNVAFTVHHKLPNQRQSYSPEAFIDDIRVLRDWQMEYGLIDVLSFDVWQRDEDIPKRYIDLTLELFSDTGTRIAVEDFGLTDGERAQVERLKGTERFGYLMDLGHLNIRLGGTPTEDSQWFRFSGESGLKPGDRSGQAFYNALMSKEFPVFEMHIHNNDGCTDWHDFLDAGVMDIAAVCGAVKRFGFDGIMTIETAPTWHKCFGEEADRRILGSLGYLKKCLEM